MIVIDGHNLLWAVREIPGGPEVRDEAGLCHVVSRYLRSVGDKGEIVFDGTGPSDKTVFDSISSLDVFFAGLGADADTVIEDKLRASTATREMTVISSDRRLRRAAQSQRATAMKCDEFWRIVKAELSRASAEQEPSAKRRGLSESETDRWLEMFGLDQ